MHTCICTYLWPSVFYYTKVSFSCSVHRVCAEVCAVYTYIYMLFPTWVYVKACADSKNHKKHKKQKETYTGFVCLKRTRGAPGPVRGIFGCAPGVRRQQKKHVPEIWISIGFLQVRKRRRAKFSLKIRCAPRYPPYIYIYTHTLELAYRFKAI